MALSVFNALPFGSRLSVVAEGGLTSFGSGVNVLGDGMWMPGVEDLAMLGPLWGLVATLIAILIGALVFGRVARLAGGLAIVGCLATAWLCLHGSARLEGNWAGMAPDSGAAMLIADQFSYFLIFLVSVFLVVVAGMWFLGHEARPAAPPARKGDAAEFFVLLVGSAFGMALMVSTTNLLMIILAVEMTSLPSYMLVRSTLLTYWGALP